MTIEPKALQLAKAQREISIAEFFARNRHLLGFDNPKKALLTTVKEAVDNAMDAAEEAGVLPEVRIEISNVKEGVFRVIIEDNGPGIVTAQIPRIFGKLLYGSKFYKLSQSRGQQGIGISASVLYGQMTTGKPAKVISRISPDHEADYMELHLEAERNEPKILRYEQSDWNPSWIKGHGTHIEIELEGKYVRGLKSVEAYLLHTAIINPHAHLIYKDPDGKYHEFMRITTQLPKPAKEIKPHPYGVELGVLNTMLRATKTPNLSRFLQKEFCRVGSTTADEICKNAGLAPQFQPKRINNTQAAKLQSGIRATKIMNPPTSCLSPIGEELIELGLRKEINADYYCSAARPPSVYRGNPFQIEVGIAYGGDQTADDSITLLRFANRVPLIYQQSACAITEVVKRTAWKNYGLNQSRGALPAGPMTLLVHIASTWVPFTSESKEALAHYPEIMKQIKLCLQEAGRQLQRYVRKKRRTAKSAKTRRSIEKYIPHVAEALNDLIGADISAVEADLAKILDKSYGKEEAVKTKNVDFDEARSLKKLKKEENKNGE